MEVNAESDQGQVGESELAASPSAVEIAAAEMAIRFRGSTKQTVSLIEIWKARQAGWRSLGST